MVGVQGPERNLSPSENWQLLSNTTGWLYTVLRIKICNQIIVQLKSRTSSHDYIYPLTLCFHAVTLRIGVLGRFRETFT